MKRNFLKDGQKNNKKIDILRDKYLNGDKNAIVKYCELVLKKSEYPGYLPNDFELEYNPENKILIIEYALPSPDDLPTLKEVKYIVTRKEFKEVHINSAAMNKIYDSGRLPNRFENYP